MSRNQSGNASNRSSNAKFPSYLSDNFPSFPRRNNDVGLIKNGDKTMCQNCGVSYLTISETRALQARIKELELKLSEFQDMKATLGNLKKPQNAEIFKKDELIKSLRARQSNLESELSSIKNREAENKCLREKIRNLENKLASGGNNASGDNYVGTPSVFEEEILKQNTVLNDRLRNLSTENAVSNELHSNLRETIDKLKNDNTALNQEISSLRVKLDEAELNIQTKEAICERLRTEQERLQKSTKELETKFRLAIDQNAVIKRSIDPKLVENLQKSLLTLQKQFHLQKTEMERCRKEYEAQLVAARNETQFEKERADECLVNSLKEREEIENLWNERWTRHQVSLSEQWESLKSNYESMLATAKENEGALQKELDILKERSQQNKDAWENYRTSLADQIKDWKHRYEMKHSEFEVLQRSKVEVELMYQEKTSELENLHEIVRDGCEERQNLQKLLERKENEIDEFKLQDTSSIPGSRARLPSSSVSKLCLPPPTEFRTARSTQSISSGVSFSDSETNYKTHSKTVSSFPLVHRADPDQSLGLFTVGFGKGNKKKCGNGMGFSKCSKKKDTGTSGIDLAVESKSVTSTISSKKSNRSLKKKK